MADLQDLLSGSGDHYQRSASVCTLYHVRHHLAHLATRSSLLAVEVLVVFLVILTSLPRQMRLLILTRHSKCTESNPATFSS